MIGLLLFSISISLLLGLLVVYGLWPKRGDTLLKISIAGGLGFGLISFILFFWLLIVGSTYGFPMLEKIVFIPLIIFFLYIVRKKKNLCLRSAPQEDFGKSKIEKVLSILFPLALVLASLTFVFVSLKEPHGGWDAWAVWNMRARFLLRAEEGWREAFSPLLAQSSYPLLIPLNIVHGWKNIGYETVMMPVALAYIFTFSSILLTTSSLSILRGKNQGILAGLVLLGSAYFIKHGASQYGDIPVGFFFLSTLVLLVLYDVSSSRDYKLLLFAGMVAGFSGWTKNEGLLFLALIIAVRLFLVVKGKGWMSALKQMAIFFLGTFPILLMIGYFKINLSSPLDLIEAQGLKVTFERLVDYSRYIQVFKAYFITGLKFTKGVVGLPLMALYFFLVGRKADEKKKTSIYTVLITIILMLIGYFFVFVTTPRDLSFELKYALNRLFLQLWPSFVFLFFMVVRTPEEALGSLRVKSTHLT